MATVSALWPRMWREAFIGLGGAARPGPTSPLEAAPPGKPRGFPRGRPTAQDLATRNPERVAPLVLFATFPGGLFGIPAPWPVLRRLFGVPGLSPGEAARQVWPVTYSAAYLAAHPDAVEAQMRREIAHPTPDHAARGQGAA